MSRRRWRRGCGDEDAAKQQGGGGEAEVARRRRRGGGGGRGGGGEAAEAARRGDGGGEAEPEETTRRRRGGGGGAGGGGGRRRRKRRRRRRKESAQQQTRAPSAAGLTELRRSETGDFRSKNGAEGGEGVGTSFDRRFGTHPPSSYLRGTGVCYRCCVARAAHQWPQCGCSAWCFHADPW